MTSETMLQCYNRGCGQKYTDHDNKEDSCRHHPGDPFFHDAYKGWTCCNKKCTDFTEFLNIKGCTLSKHSNVKPPEPELVKKVVPEVEVPKVKPIKKTSLSRPPFSTPMTKMIAEVAPSLKTQAISSVITEHEKKTDEITIGTSCKNGCCKEMYTGPETDETPCVHHPGVPIFHEGLKFWSCCQKRTSDFNVFLNQVGCETGRHVWIKQDETADKVACRWDYHQTGSHVIVSIYAKQYCPEKSEVKLSPVRIYANIVFPLQGGAAFTMDEELQGMIDVLQSKVSMYGTKVEIKMKKAEPSSWSKLHLPKEVKELDTLKSQHVEDTLESQVESVDLSDL